MANHPSAPGTLDGKVPLRNDIETAFASIRGVIKASLRPSPTETEDGSYVSTQESTGLLQDLQKVGFKDVESVIEVIGAKLSGKPTNDKNYLMEKVIGVRPQNECHDIP